jgi:hypothetical protein
MPITSARENLFVSFTTLRITIDGDGLILFAQESAVNGNSLVILRCYCFVLHPQRFRLAHEGGYGAPLRAVNAWDFLYPFM